MGVPNPPPPPGLLLSKSVLNVYMHFVLIVGLNQVNNPRSATVVHVSRLKERSPTYKQLTSFFSLPDTRSTVYSTKLTWMFDVKISLCVTCQYNFSEMFLIPGGALGYTLYPVYGWPAGGPGG